MEKKYLIFKTVTDMNQLPLRDRFNGLLAYAIDTNEFYKIDNDLNNFQNIRKGKSFHISASKFVNLTIYHNLNTDNVQVITYDSLYNSVNIPWKMGSRINNNADSDNAITLMSQFPILEIIHIRIIEL